MDHSSTEPENPDRSSPEIPGPKIEELSANVADSLSSEEFAHFAAGTLDTRILDWKLGFCLKIILFTFVIGINVWWSIEVERMLWHSGVSGSTFHLNDSVLIALVTTSIANFLALVIVVARHLFPSGPLGTRH